MNSPKFSVTKLRKTIGRDTGAGIGDRTVHRVPTGDISGKIVRASPDLMVNGQRICGFVVECSGVDLINIGKRKLYNQNVYVMPDRRGKSRHLEAMAAHR